MTVRNVGKVSVTTKGAWSAGSYEKLDIVEHNGSSYICTANGTTSTPPGTGWTLIASKGAQGEQGEQGETGEGVPSGGSAGQILAKRSGTNYDAEWVDKPNSAVWGGIEGTLSDQSDLQDELDAKQDVISDLDTIRSGAALGATALQVVPSTYRTASAQDAIDATKQGIIFAYDEDGCLCQVI